MLCLEYLAQRHKSGPLKTKMTYNSQIADMKIVTLDTEINALLLSPLTFMNIIGKNVAKAMKSERIL